MQPAFSLRLITISISFLLTINSNGQSIKSNFDKKTVIEFDHIYLNDKYAPISTIEELKRFKPRLYDVFTESFPNSSDISVNIVDNISYIYCNLNGIATRIAYDKKDRLDHMIRSYMEENLPGKIRHIIKRTFYDFNILSVTELSLGNKITYVVNIEDKTSFKQINVIDGEMEVIHEYERG